MYSPPPRVHQHFPAIQPFSQHTTDFTSIIPGARTQIPRYAPSLAPPLEVYYPRPARCGTYHPRLLTQPQLLLHVTHRQGVLRQHTDLYILRPCSATHCISCITLRSPLSTV